MMINFERTAGADERAMSQRTGVPASQRFSNSRFLPLRGVRGFTLTEVMVAAGVGSIVLAVVAMVFMNSTRSFAAMSNYVMMDRSSRTALDHLTREARRAGTLTDYASTSTSAFLKFEKYGMPGVYVIYQWDSTSRQLTESNAGNTTILLTECDELSFTLYSSSSAATTSVSDAKSISVFWRCSRTILGAKSNSEAMQQAVIVIRNK